MLDINARNTFFYLRRTEICAYISLRPLPSEDYQPLYLRVDLISRANKPTVQIHGTPEELEIFFSNILSDIQRARSVNLDDIRRDLIGRYESGSYHHYHPINQRLAPGERHEGTFYATSSGEMSNA